MSLTRTFKVTFEVDVLFEDAGSLRKHIKEKLKDEVSKEYSMFLEARNLGVEEVKNDEDIN